MYINQASSWATSILLGDGDDDARDDHREDIDLRGVGAFELGEGVFTAPAPPRMLDSSSNSPLFLRNATCLWRCMAILSCNVVYNISKAVQCESQVKQKNNLIVLARAQLTDASDTTLDKISDSVPS